MERIGDSELILNNDGSIFHLHLKPEHIAETVLLVGDPGRVEMIAKYLSNIEFTIKNREFVSTTGTYNNKRITVIATGIGTDNIDIVINEIDAITNIDLTTRSIKSEKRILNFVRIGTSGALQPDIPVDTPVVSQWACGFDGLLNYYANRDKVCNLDMENAFTKYVNWHKQLTAPYITNSSQNLFDKFKDWKNGITISAPGFYGPQGRVLRLPIVDPDINNKISNFDYNGLKFTNYEMECSAIYGLSNLLGHNALTICCIIANRMRKEYSKDYKLAVEKIVQSVLDRLTL